MKIQVSQNVTMCHLANSSRRLSFDCLALKWRHYDPSKRRQLLRNNIVSYCSSASSPRRFQYSKEGEGRTAVLPSPSWRIETYKIATYNIRTLLKMDYWSPKHVEQLNVMNKINHQILCILLDYRYTTSFPSVSISLFTASDHSNLHNLNHWQGCQCISKTNSVHHTSVKTTKI